jgi:hypothetical protein
LDDRSQSDYIVKLEIAKLERDWRGLFAPKGGHQRMILIKRAASAIDFSF